MREHKQDLNITNIKTPPLRPGKIAGGFKEKDCYQFDLNMVTEVPIKMEPPKEEPKKK
jgi:hypothetical protein